MLECGTCIKLAEDEIDKFVDGVCVTCGEIQIDKRRRDCPKCLAQKMLTRRRTFLIEHAKNDPDCREYDRLSQWMWDVV